METLDFAPLRISRAPSTSPSSAPSPEPWSAKKTSASRWDNVFQVVLLFCAILWYTGFAIHLYSFCSYLHFPHIDFSYEMAIAAPLARRCTMIMRIFATKMH